MICIDIFKINKGDADIYFTTEMNVNKDKILKKNSNMIMY